MRETKVGERWATYKTSGRAKTKDFVSSLHVTPLGDSESHKLTLALRVKGFHSSRQRVNPHLHFN
jgi:hypothetical protein